MKEKIKNNKKDSITIGNPDVMVRANRHKAELEGYFYVALFDKSYVDDLVQHTLIRAGRYLSLDDDDKSFRKKLFIIATEVLFWFYGRQKTDMFHAYNVIQFKDENSEDSFNKYELLTIDGHYDDSGVDYGLLLNIIRKKLSERDNKLLTLVLNGYESKEVAHIMGYKNWRSATSMRTQLFAKIKNIMREMGFVVKDFNGKRRIYPSLR